MAGVSSPAILFPDTSEGSERRYLRSLIEALRRDGYTRYVEANAGAWSMPAVARAAGFHASEITGTDATLFSAVLGSLFAGRPLRDLNVRIDGDEYAPKEGVEGAAELLYFQLLLRMEARPAADYWRELIEDLTTRGQAHVEAIAARLREMLARLDGCEFIACDPVATLERFGGDRVIIGASPCRGSERFFATDGRLEWDAPRCDGDVAGLLELAAGAEALVLLREQRAPGEASHDRPVYARHVSRGVYSYVVSNRPDEVFGLVKPCVQPRSSREIGPVDEPLLPFDHELGEASEVSFFPIESSQSAYYRELWLRRADTAASHHAGVLVDGFFAGMAGISTNPAHASLDMQERVFLLLRYALGAPHATLRLSRLVATLMRQRPVLEAALPASAQIYVTMADRLHAVEASRRPESRDLRGLMELASKHEDVEGWRLTYVCPITDLTLKEAVAEWLTAERKWQARSMRGAP